MTINIHEHLPFSEARRSGEAGRVEATVARNVDDELAILGLRQEPLPEQGWYLGHLETGRIW